MAELLVEFFRYYSWRFDLLRHVVSMRTRRVVTKLDKTETHAWFHSDHLRYYYCYTCNVKYAHYYYSCCHVCPDIGWPTLLYVPSLLLLLLFLFYFLLLLFSIEDPFETHYDVAHVIKGPQMAYLRKEFLVSPSFHLSIYLHIYLSVPW